MLALDRPNTYDELGGNLSVSSVALDTLAGPITMESTPKKSAVNRFFSRRDKPKSKIVSEAALLIEELSLMGFELKHWSQLQMVSMLIASSSSCHWRNIYAASSAT